jgi:lipopolysaccharide/colanic/teichoic acid biosynthesis glycosyltransferase
MGLDGRKFDILKYRSMRTDAEKETGAVWAKKDDPRRTWLGAMLRKTSLDELPQFINVLKGDMSIVGPRPERPVFINDFKKQVPRYMLRHKMKAGITGWAQVNGWRGDTSLLKRIQYDIYYIENWSIWFDIRIMFMTLYRGLVSRSAY